MSIKLCVDVINAADVSLCNLDGVTCLKSDKVGSILMPVTMDNGRPAFTLIPVANPRKINGKYLGEKSIESDKELSDAYGTKRNSLMTKKIAWCIAVLEKPGAWVFYDKMTQSHPYEVFDDNGDNLFDVEANDAKNGPFILRINNKDEFSSTGFDEYVMKQLRALWQKAKDKEQGK